MKLKILILVVVAMCAGALKAQHKVKFIVTDSVSTPEPFATVRIYQLPDTAKAVLVTTTDLEGKFSDKVNETGDYRIVISSLGKMTHSQDKRIDTDVNLGTIIMRTAAAVLEAVDVVAQRPMVTTEIDRYVYDMKADEEAKTNNIFEMLKKVPMVTVDGEENIKVKGQSNFRIFKNGRPNSSWEKNPKDVLKSIPASMIKKVEVITEPGAKYDAEGVDGILNIVTDDDVTAKGIMGSVGASVNERGGTNAYGYATVQYDKLVLSANYGVYFSPKGNYKSRQNSEQIYKETGNRLLTNTDNDGNESINHNFSFEASYDIDTLNLITAEFHGWFPFSKMDNYAYTKMLDANDDPIYSYTAHSYYPKYDWNSFGGKIDYQRLTRCKDETITISYMIDSNSDNGESASDFIDIVGAPNFNYTRYLATNYERNLENTFQIDWSRPFLKYNRIEAGLKYILRTNSSTTEQTYAIIDNPEWVSPNNMREKFKHDTHIASAYAEYAYNSKRFGARAGVRYEFAYNNVKYPLGNKKNFNNHIGDVVPTFSGSWKINDANTLKLNFATRVRRPGIYYLNPAVVETPNTVRMGNPDLVSVRNHKGSVSYSLMKPKIMVSVSGSFGLSNNDIMEYSYADDKGVIWTKYGNIGRRRNVSLNGYVQYRPSPKTSLMVNFGGNYSHISRPGTDESNEGIGANIYANVFQQLMWKIKLNVFGSYYHSGPYSLYDKKSHSYYFYGLSLSRSWLKNDRLTLRVSVNNPFPAWRKMDYSSETPTYAQYSHIRTTSTKFNIGISYRFGSLNAYVKKARKSISNDDVQTSGGSGSSGGGAGR